MCYRVGGQALSGHLGICVPPSCTGPALEALLEQGVLTPLEKLFGRVLDAPKIDCKSPNRELDGAAIACIVLLVILASLCVAGTVVDLLFRARKERYAELLGNSSDGLEAPLLGGGAALSLNSQSAMPREPVMSFGERLLHSFSVPHNLVRLSAERPSNLTALNGLRVFCIIWIILGHTNIYQNNVGIKNPGYLLNVVVKRPSFQLVVGADMGVDAFFFLSGFLVAYMAVDELANKGRINWGLYYFHRIWRLTPSYAFVLFIYVALSPYMGSGPMWNTYQATLGFTNTTPSNACSKYWWTNLLYINNLYPADFEDQCFKWGWYLAIDTQLYAISPIFLFAYHKSRRIGWALVVFAAFLGTAIRCILIEVNHLTLSGAAAAHELNELYGKPWSRMAPYMIGMAVAFRVLEIRNKDGHMNRSFSKLHDFVGKPLAWATMIACVFGKYQFFKHGLNWGGAEEFFYLGFVRTSFALGLGYILFFSFFRKGGIVRAILGAAPLTTFARLTYNTYLVHPAMISVVYFSQSDFPIYSNLTTAQFFFSNVIMAFGLATLVFLMVEKPMMNLEVVLFHRKKRAGPKPTKGTN